MTEQNKAADEAARTACTVTDEAARVGEETARAGADIARRGTETARDTFQSGLNTASETFQRMADQFTQVLGFKPIQGLHGLSLCGSAVHYTRAVSRKGIPYRDATMLRRNTSQ